MKKILVFLLSYFFFFGLANSEVIDSANMFSSQVISNVNQKLGEIKRKSGKELVIETVEDTGKRDANEFALEKAKERKVNGVYVLISKKDRKLKVEVGNKTKLVFGDFERNTLKAKFTEEFKNKNFDGGLISSTEYFEGVMETALTNKKNLTSNQTYPQRTATPIRSNQNTGGISWMTIIFFGLIAFIAFRIISSLMNKGRRGPMGGNQGYGANTGGYGGSGPGFMGTFLTGMLGAAAGSWLYDKFSGNDGGLFGNDNSQSDNYMSQNGGNDSSWSQSDTDYSSDSSDSGSWGDSGGSDWGGGGDSDW